MDGAMGTMLQKQGMQPGSASELFGLETPEVLADIHYRYVQAVADIIETNTFGANYYKTAGLRIRESSGRNNQEAVRIAKRDAPAKPW